MHLPIIPAVSSQQLPHSKCVFNYDLIRRLKQLVCIVSPQSASKALPMNTCNCGRICQMLTITFCPRPPKGLRFALLCKKHLLYVYLLPKFWQLQHCSHSLMSLSTKANLPVSHKARQETMKEKEEEKGEEKGKRKKEKERRGEKKEKNRKKIKSVPLCSVPGRVYVYM